MAGADGNGVSFLLVFTTHRQRPNYLSTLVYPVKVGSVVANISLDQVTKNALNFREFKISRMHLTATSVFLVVMPDFVYFP